MTSAQTPAIPANAPAEPFTAQAIGATSSGAPLEPLEIQRRAVGPLDVLIDIQFCGVCHSDIHHARGDWGDVPFPAVPGHEIAGIVAAVGRDVIKHQVGDRVGVGCMVNSCGQCEACKAGNEQYCAAGGTPTYGAVDRDGTITHGGYSSHVVVTEHFVVRIPDAIALDAAAPLLCAGITTYSPLYRFGAGPGKKIAVVGLGGLGHMGVQFAHALGADVTVLSQTIGKQDDGLRLGAQDYRATSDPATFQELAGSFDLVLNTVSAKIDLDAYLTLLRPNGTLVNVGAPGEPLSLNVFSLLLGGKQIAGSIIGSIAETQEMLDFCAEHDIASAIELINADQINDAWDRVLASDVRYRFVIDSATIAGVLPSGR